LSILGRKNAKKSAKKGDEKGNIRQKTLAKREEICYNEQAVNHRADMHH
jgi:hypothetical protein